MIGGDSFDKPFKNPFGKQKNKPAFDINGPT